MIRPIAKVLGTNAARAAVLVAIGLAAPSAHAAWDYGFDSEAEADWAWTSDVAGRAQLEVYCDPFDWWFTLFTNENYHSGTSYAREVPLNIVIDNATRYELVGSFKEFDGELVVDVSYFDDERVIDLAKAMAVAESRIEISYFNASFIFPATNASAALGEFLSFCG